MRLIMGKGNFMRRDNVRVLILSSNVMQNIGFSQGKPVAAFTIYKCLVHWKSFEAERTSVFDCLIQMIGFAIENEENNPDMAYWLSNASTLLFLLQRSLKSDKAEATPPKKHPPKSLFGRVTQGFRSSPSANPRGLDVVRQVEAKYPAMLFNQQLTAYVEIFFGIIRDNLKKELQLFLTSCIQAPRSSKASMLRSSSRSFGYNTASNYWHNIIDCLNSSLDTLQENHVPPILVKNIYIQVFSYINMQLFNSLLLRRECCSFRNGECVKAGLAELELWCAQATKEYVGASWDELKHIHQAVGFMMICNWTCIITNDLYPMLSAQQLYRICTQYWDNNYGTESISSSVITSMRVLMTEDSNTAATNSFVLDENSGIPFSVDDLTNSLQEKDSNDVKPAQELLENPAFQFLNV